MAVTNLTEARIRDLPLGSGIHRDAQVKGLMPRHKDLSAARDATPKKEEPYGKDQALTGQPVGVRDGRSEPTCEGQD